MKIAFQQPDTHVATDRSNLMDFFGQQDRARASTNRLVTLFVLAVVMTNLAIYFATAGALHVVYLFTTISTRSTAQGGWLARIAHHFATEGLWNWELLGWVTLFVTTVVGLVTAWKLRQLSHGGAVVAQWLGGRLVSVNTDDAEERRLLNVVEEMAIAAGVPVPDVYLLDEECGINAFAAGQEPQDAVIGVTFGALKLLSRDEMQGVIAHEFSHILNGDMRLNTRLIGWLHGVLGLVVLGRILTLSFLRHDTGPRAGERVGPIFHPALLPAYVLGAICIVAGSFGAFFARLIKSAVSRQREYLADASAVQFTRHPDGIVGALKKIGGLNRRSRLAAARAEEASHMYFGDGMKPRWFGFLATHPPLTKRIERINPYFDGKFPPVSLERVLRESPVTAVYREQGNSKSVDFEKLASVVGGAAAAQEMLYAHAAQESRPSRPEPPVPPAATSSLPELLPPIQLHLTTTYLGTFPSALRTATQDAASAVALIYGLLLSKEDELRTTQQSQLAQRIEPNLATEVNRLLPLIDGLDTGYFLTLADLSIRALRHLSPTQYENFRATLEWLVESDQQIDLFEYMLQRMVVRHLDPHFRPTKKPLVQYYAIKLLLPDCAVLLSGLARIGQDNETDALAAFQKGAALLHDPDLRLLPLSECNLPHMDTALERIAQATPQLKEEILIALTATAANDGELQRREAELLRAVADALGVAVPPFLVAGRKVIELAEAT